MRFLFTACALSCFALTALGAGWPLLVIGASHLVVSFLWSKDDDDDTDGEEK